MATDPLEEALRQLAEGVLSVDEAQTALAARADYSFGTNPAWVKWRRPLGLGERVPLTISQVRGALQRFLDGRWPARDLHLWAQFIVLVGAFEFLGQPDAGQDYYDAAWDVLQDISCPEVHGVATEAFARAQLKALERYG